MAQAMLQRQYRPENDMPPPPWRYQQRVSREQMPLVAESPNPIPSNEIPQNQFWRGTPASDNGVTAWSSVLPMKPWIVSDPRYHHLQNNDLTYNDMVAQNASGKSANAYGSQPYWSACRPSDGVPRGVSVNGSDLETNNSLSPKSHLDEKLELESFSPGSMPDQASASDDWNGYSTSFTSVKESSPKSASSGLHLVPAPARTDENVGNFDCAGLPQIGLGIMMRSMEPAGSSYQNGELTGLIDDAHQTNSEYSYSHGSSLCVSPWYFPGYSHDLAGLPYRRRDHQSNNVRDEVFSDASPSQSSNSYTQQQTASWSESRVGAPAQVKLQDRFQVPRSADTQTQRKHNDDLLIEGKKEGLTYKEIRKKLVGEKPAESTLRGRYRSLTKARKDRVRKPIWRTRDIELLNMFVEREFDRIESTLAHPEALSLEQKLVKVQWKKVADYINEQGGSYHFGNSTCKRKWLEVNKDS